jgi:fucose permease
VERFAEKPVMIAAFVAATLGSMSFALFPLYKVAVVSLFVIGAGMATLQVAINPLLRVAGGEEHFAFNEVLAQLLFGCASFISPQIYSYLVLNLNHNQQNSNVLFRVLKRLTPGTLPWVSLYWIFTMVAFAMVILLCALRFPRVQHTADERPGTLECTAASCGGALFGSTSLRFLLTWAANRELRIGFHSSLRNITTSIRIRPVLARSPGFGACLRRAAWQGYCS